MTDLVGNKASPIDALYEAAQKATPGPWHVAGDYSGEVRTWVPDGVRQSGKHKGEPRSPREQKVVGIEPAGACGDPDCCPQGDVLVLTSENATFIAAADPQTVMALVELYRAAKCYEEHDHSTHIESRECSLSVPAAIAAVEKLNA